MRSVDERIVEMRIDNQQFKKGAKESISILDKLKRSLDLEGAEKNLEQLDKAGKRFSLEGMAENIELISSRFTTMGIIGTRVLTNLVDSAMRTGKQMVSALTINPMKMGFSEYETQINAIQTILANTRSKGTTIDQINEALDELNEYADLTIYNYTQMTESIGRFTATGLDVDISTASIKGMSNLAAMAGSTAAQLNNAMYQLSQGLSAGVIKLQDWNSLRNANLTNEAFEESLMETARVHGVAIDEMIAKYGSLEHSLQQGWLTSEIMMETLLKFTGDYTDAEWIALGYTEEQAKAIVELGKTAKGAATDIKTFTQLIDTTKEALQSGWTQTWEIIIGDFEEAKTLWNGVKAILDESISKSADARNAMFKSWASLGGRTDIIEGISNIFQSLMNVIASVSEAFREIFPPITGKQLADISESFLKFTERLKEGTSDLNNLKTAFKGFFSLIKGALTALNGALTVLNPITKLIPVAVTAIINASSAIGNLIMNITNATTGSKAFEMIIATLTGVVESAVNAITKFSNGLKIEWPSEMAESMSSISDSAKNIGVSMAEAFANTSLVKNFMKVIDKIKTSMSELNFIDIVGAGSLTGIALGLRKLIDSVSGALYSFSDGFGGIGTGLKGILDSVQGSLKAFESNINANTLIKIAKSIGILAISLIGLSLVDGENIGPGLVGISVLLGEMVAVMKIFAGFNAKGLAGSLASLASLTVSTAILSAALLALKQFDSIDDVAVPLGSIMALMLSLVGTTKLFRQIDGGGLGKASASLVMLSTAILVMATALTKLSAINFVSALSGLASMGIALTEMAVFIKLISGSKLGGISVSMIGISASMIILAKALQSFAGIDISTLAVGFGSLAAMLASLSVTSKFIRGINLIGISMSMLGLSASMLILAQAMNGFAGMGLGTIVAGLGTLAGALIGLSVASNFVKPASVISVAASLSLLAAGLLLLVAPIVILGNLPWETLVTGIVSVISAMATIGAVTMILAPFSAGILAVSAALALFGATILAIGGGIALFATGLSILASSAVAGAAALLAAIPIIGDALLSLVITAAQVIQLAAPTIMETIAILIQALLETLVAYGPSILSAAWELFKNLVVGLINVGAELLSALWGVLQQVGAAIGNFVKPMFEAGQNLVQGLINGILSMPGKIWDAATNLGNSFLTKIRDVLGIHSPSKETYSDGANVVQGLVNGITSGYGSAEEAGAGLAQATQNGSRNSLQELLASFRTAGTDAGTGFSTSAGTAIKKEKAPEESAKDKAQEIKDAFEKELKSTEFDTEQLNLEFDIWEAQTKKTVKAQDYYAKKKAYINKKIEYQTTVTAKAEEKYRKMVETFGKSSDYAREAYNEWLTEQKELTELGNDLADLTEETVDKINSAYDKMNQSLEARATKLDLQEQIADSLAFDPTQVESVSVDVLAKNVTKAENEYKKAVVKFGKDSDEAVAAYEKLELARKNYSRSQGGVFDAELEYKRAVKEYGADSEEALAAYEAYQTAMTNAERRKDYGGELDSQLSALEDVESYYKSIVKEFGADSEEASYAKLLIEQAQADLDAAQNVLDANARQKAYSNFTNFLRSMGKYGPQADKASNALAKYKELLEVPGVDQATLDEAYNEYLQEQVNLLGIIDNFAEEASLGEGAHTALSIFAKALGENWPLVTDKWSGLVQNLGPILEKLDIDPSVASFVKKIFENPSLETILSEGLSYLIKSFLSGGSIDSIIFSILPALGKIPEILAGVLPNLGTLFAGGGGFISTLVSGLSGAFGSIGSLISGVVSTAGSGLMSLAGALGPVGIAIGGVVAVLGTLFATSKDFRDFVIGAFSAIGNAITNVFNTIKNVITGIFQTIYNVVKGIVDAVMGFFDMIGSAFKNIMSAFSNFSLPNLFGGGGGGEGASEGEKEGASVGGSIIGGIVKGLTNPIGTIIGAVSKVCSSVVNGFKNFFGIHSPSRVFAGLGGQLIDGLVVGLDRSTPEATKTIGTFGAVIDQQMSALIADIDDVAEPTIRPVLDTSNVTSGVRNMSNLLSRDASVRLSGNVSEARKTISYADQSRANQNGTNTTSTDGTSGPSYSFTQNNYSPKALSKSEIYRQTRNQFSMLKGRA